MILPPELLNAYKKKAGFYNQNRFQGRTDCPVSIYPGRSSCCTDQKAETTLFLQIKAASQLSPSGIWHWLSDSGGAAGTSLALTLPYEKSGDELKKQAY